jgi:hypothetical protein
LSTIVRPGRFRHISRNPHGALRISYENPLANVAHGAK